LNQFVIVPREFCPTLFKSYTRFFRSCLLRSPSSFIARSLANIQTQPIRIQIHLILRALKDLRNIPCVLKLPEINIRTGLLNGITNKLGRACFTLCADYHSLLLLTGFIDNEGCALGFLLRDLLSFDCGGKLR
jgi:hypothetical protein